MLLYFEIVVKLEIGGFFKLLNDNYIIRENNNKLMNEKKLIIEIGERGEFFYEVWVIR